MIDALFSQQRQYLNYFFDSVDPLQAEKFLQACLHCKGMLLITGVGKSGIIGEKMAMTLVSTGTRALFLPPVNLLHGDLGIMREEDIFIVMSKSGETEELLELFPFVRRRASAILGITSNPHSRLAKEADVAIVLPVEKELCPFDLAPTTSTTVQLLFGDALAVALMKTKSFTLSDYAVNHPAGTIGKKMHLTVGDLMWHGEKIPFCHPTDLLSDVLVELSNKQCGCLLITTPEQKLLGIFTDGDLRRGLQSHGPALLERSMESLMQQCSVHLDQKTLAWEAVKVLQQDPSRFVMVAPVLKEDKVVGLLRLHDIVNAGLSDYTERDSKLLNNS